MSATEELRQLLDKHGIEWWSDGDISSDHTEWTTDSMSFTSLGMGGDKLAIQTITTLTPRQALDATLRRVIRDDTLRREHEARMNLQRDYNNQCDRIHNQRRQLAEMQAARGTCHIRLTECCDWKCDQCGSAIYYSSAHPAYGGMKCNYCPSCGRRVI